MKKTLAATAVAALVLVASAAAAFAVTATMGNSATDRTYADTWQNFTVVDTNNAAPFDGTFTTVNYFAERPGTIHFLVVDSSNTVTWVSEAIPVTTAGTKQYTTAAPVGVVAGSHLGVYSQGAGVVSFDFGGDPAMWEAYGAGLPVVDEILDYVGTQQGRTYSMNTTVKAASPEICKDGGWETYGYKNQGQCIASIVANENAGK